MTRVDFYILHGSSSPSERDDFACRLVNKALRRGTETFLAAQSTEHAHALGQLLQQSDSAYSLEAQAQARLRIAEALQPGQHSECLINLSHSVPGCAARFQRVCEIVVFDTTLHAATRENFRFYRDRGFPLHTHNINVDSNAAADDTLNQDKLERPAMIKASVPA